MRPHDCNAVLSDQSIQQVPGPLVGSEEYEATDADEEDPRPNAPEEHPPPPRRGRRVTAPLREYASEGVHHSLIRHSVGILYREIVNE